MFLLLLSTFLFAQEESSNRWELLPQQKLQAGFALASPRLEFRIEPEDDTNAHDLTFEPNNGATKNLILGINQSTIAIGLGTSSESDSPVKTKGFDVLYRTYFSKYGLDVYYQTYKGFYLEDEGTIYKYPDLKQRKVALYLPTCLILRDILYQPRLAIVIFSEKVAALF